MPKTSAQQYRLDTEGEEPSFQNTSRDAETFIKVAETPQAVPGSNTRKAYENEKVGEDSLPGFVRRNKRLYEVTEGRH